MALKHKTSEIDTGLRKCNANICWADKVLKKSLIYKHPPHLNNF